MSGVDLTAIEGIDAPTALTLLSDIGLDLSRFPRLKHFCSWLGLCPPHQISAGKIKSRHVRPGANRVAQALRLAARSLHHAKTALGGFFRRLKSRMGTAQAMTATAHKLARLVYTQLKHGTAYVQQGLQEYEARYRDREVRHVARKARELGFDLVPVTTC
jgi:transposase